MKRLLSKLGLGSKKFQQRHFLRREVFRADYEVLAASLMRRLDFDSVIDIGCANGFLVSAFHGAGKEAGGIERSSDVVAVLPPALVPLVQIGDFSAATTVSDLVCCVEVAEHIPPERSEELVRKISSLAGRWVLFGAAPPGQGGRGHINLREPHEWLHWFEDDGWVINEALTAAVRGDLEVLENAPWLRTNCMVLEPAGQAVGS